MQLHTIVFFLKIVLYYFHFHHRALAAERDGFVEESELLRDTLREQEGQMSMVTNTMRGLRKDMDKVNT